MFLIILIAVIVRYGIRAMRTGVTIMVSSDKFYVFAAILAVELNALRIIDVETMAVRANPTTR